MDRRKFLKKVSKLSLGLGFYFSGSTPFKINEISAAHKSSEFLIKDPDKILTLHRALNYKIISRYGDKMSDGYQVPHSPDGMACFQKKEKLDVLLRIIQVKVHWEVINFLDLITGDYEGSKSDRKLKH